VRAAGQTVRDFMNVLAVTVVVVLALDQLTKWLVLHNIHPHHEIPVIAGFFSLTHVLNPGAAWGMFARFGHSNTILTAFSIVTLVALWLLRRSLAAASLPHRIAFGLIVGGIFGNLADRILRGSVVDFLYFYLGGFYARWTGSDGHWPAFNIADSAICIGVGVYMVVTLWPFKSHVVPELPPNRKFGVPPTS
jgi:signal peptidase II